MTIFCSATGRSFSAKFFRSDILRDLIQIKLLEAARSEHGSAVETQRAIMQQVAAFCAGNFRDDATLLVLKMM